MYNAGGMWWLDTVLRSQFGKPSGLLGSLFFGPLLNVADQRVIDNAIRLLAVRPTDTVLDVGFGAGYSLVTMAPRLPRGHVIGVDYSFEMAELTAALLSGRHQPRCAAVTCGDALHLPFSDRAFHKAITANSIYYWPDPAAGISEIARVLRRRGRLAVGLRSPSRLRPITWTWSNFSLYEPQEIARFMESAGFRIRAIEHADRWLPLDSVVILGELR